MHLMQHNQLQAKYHTITIQKTNHLLRLTIIESSYDAEVIRGHSKSLIVNAFLE